MNFDERESLFSTFCFVLGRPNIGLLSFFRYLFGSWTRRNRFIKVLIELLKSLYVFSHPKADDRCDLTVRISGPDTILFPFFLFHVLIPRIFSLNRRNYGYDEFGFGAAVLQYPEKYLCYDRLLSPSHPEVGFYAPILILVNIDCPTWSVSQFVRSEQIWNQRARHSSSPSKWHLGRVTCAHFVG
jgi:hypothetical protein